MTFWPNAAAGFLNVDVVLNFVSVSDSDWKRNGISSPAQSVRLWLAVKYRFTWPGKPGPDTLGHILRLLYGRLIESKSIAEATRICGLPSEHLNKSHWRHPRTVHQLTCRSPARIEMKRGEGGRGAARRRGAHASNNFVCACHKRQLTG